MALVFRLARNAGHEELIRVGAALFFVIFAEIALINIVKIPWGRARMRLVANDPRACFMPWWQTGSELKDTLVAAGALEPVENAESVRENNLPETPPPSS